LAQQQKSPGHKNNNPNQRYQYDNLLNEIEDNYKVIEELIKKLEHEEEKVKLLQNKIQTLRTEKKKLQDQLNNRSQPKPPKRINKKALFVGTGLTVAGLTYNYYNPSYSSTNQLSLNSTNNSLNLD